MLEIEKWFNKEAFLIVDDEPDMCWALERILKKNGFQCLTACNAQEALALVRERPFPLIFLDAKLPDMEGLELAQAIRKSLPSLKIVVVSGYFYGDDPGIQEAFRKGLISGFISKPFDNTEIVRTVWKVLGTSWDVS